MIKSLLPLQTFLFFVFWPFLISPIPPLSPKVSLSPGCRTWKAPSLSAASPVRCDPQCETHPHICVSFLMVIFSWLCQSRIPIVVRLCHVHIGPDTMTHDPDREIIISHWCSMWSLPSRIKKIKQHKKDLCKWPIVDWFSWSLDVASKCDQEQPLHCNHLHFKSNIFWQHTLLLILVERIIFQGCFGAFVSFCDIIVFMLCTCLSSKVILID